MRSANRFLCLGAVAACCWSAPSRGDEIPAKSVDGKITWLHKYEDAKKQAKESGKPLFVVFRCER